MKKIWWKEAVGYQIYLRSFCDSDGDGLGDLQGIINKLDYLQNLGVNLLWVCPFYPSPMDDNGYDVKDFYGVASEYGDLATMEKLLAEAHQRGMKVIIDLVLNHCSDEHPWFLEAISAKNHPLQSYFYFLPPRYDAEGNRKPPTNWKSFFCESAWQYVPEIDKYYLHIFSKKMPDLCWHHPALREEMYKVARFWLSKGVDGFRMDAIAHLAKDLSFSDSENPLDEQGLAYDFSKFSNREELFDFLAEFKEKVLKDYPESLTVGEVGGCASVEEGLRYVDKEQGSLNMAFTFDHCWCNGAYGSLDRKDEEIKTDLKALKEVFSSWYEGLKERAWLPLYWLNHDHPRLISQYGNVQFRRMSGSMLASVLLFLHGTPFLYQGEEIGMSNVDYTKLEDFKDVNAQNFFKEHRQKYSQEHLLHILRRISRVNARSPMQWSEDTKDLEMPVVKNIKEVNVQKEIEAKLSLWKDYQALLYLRKKYLSYVIDGKLQWIKKEHASLFAYRKEKDEGECVVLANFFETPLEISLALQGKYLCIYDNQAPFYTKGACLEEAFTKHCACPTSEIVFAGEENISLAAYQVRIYVKKN